ncbi:MAG TPA: hypothetical protein VFD82_08420 [Planctomycetota bacterium]|nr:hypothetical protein [Planctomycetota bacterium]
MELLQWVCFGLLPALAAVLLFVGAGGARFFSLGLAVAICVPFGMVFDWAAWPWELDPNRDAQQWLWWCFAAAGVVGAAYDLRLLPKPVLLTLEIAIVLLMPWLVLAPLRAGWTFERCVVMLGGAWSVLMALWWVLRATAKLQQGVAVPLAATVALIVDAIVLHAQNARPGWHLAGVAAFALAVAVATTIWRRPFVCGTGGALCIAIVHVGVLWSDGSEAGIRSAPRLLCLVALLPMWIATRPMFAEGRATGILVGLATSVGVAVFAIAML